jgi:hypothetical protein
MPAARLSSVPWFIRDWFLSPSRLKLEPDQRMAFCEILWLMYLSEDGHIENDLAYLQSITGLSIERITPVMHLLNSCNAPHFTHPKVQQVLGAIRRESESKRDAANRRWGKKKASTRNAPAMQDTVRCNASLKPEASGSAPAPPPSGGAAAVRSAARETTPPQDRLTPEARAYFERHRQKNGPPQPDLTPIPKWNGPPRRPPLPDPPPAEPNENDAIAARLMADLEAKFPSERDNQDAPTEEP